MGHAAATPRPHPERPDPDLDHHPVVLGRLPALLRGHHGRGHRRQPVGLGHGARQRPPQPARQLPPLDPGVLRQGHPVVRPPRGHDPEVDLRLADQHLVPLGDLQGRAYDEHQRLVGQVCRSTPAAPTSGPS
ncbi:hypothetical protein G5V59_03975 [Nocardioides sp. W3-2-3]|uniref:hypothetical protein n=1 Tax=Nocardioides convexus TaxID=2712224 RepID=UPI0024189CAB|nr:hypothetical protein [Nocardioides convexus]NGZ99780.1 hypothetical protein [Nocardioides convexus]